MTGAEDGDKKAMIPAELAETLNKVLEAQAQDMILKSEQNQIERERLEVDKQKDTNAFKFGMASLDAQAKDRVHARDCERGQRKDAQRMIILILLIIALLVAYALYLDKDALAEELIKAVVFLVAGGVGGYGIAMKKKSKDEGDGSGQD